MTARPVAVVIGAPGAGKTRVGRRVARLLGVAFVDVDRRIVAQHGPIAQIFAEHGESYFRQLERTEVERALGEYAVVSLGGGAILDEDTQLDLLDQTVVLMTVSAEAVEARIGGGKRPLLADGIEAWRKLVASRRATYERLATRSWDTSDRGIDEIAQEIADWIQQRKHRNT